jgi:D-aspartate ligase
MGTPAISVNAVTSATTLTALTDAAPLAAIDPAAAPSIYPHEVPTTLSLAIYGSLAAVEVEWRNFEKIADCTVFQTFDLLAAWHRHIGLRQRVQPAIVVGRFGDDATALMLPLCVETGRSARRLCWLGQDLCDYNAPLLSPEFSHRVTPDCFLAAWRELQARMQRDPLLRHDWIEFEKMPQTIGAQVNPFSYLDVTPHPSGVHLAQLGDDWEKFYTAKRSSSTRRRDRAKRRHMSEHGEIRFVSAADADDARRTVETLMEQKSRSFAHKGIPDLFARPGYREFYLDLAANPRTRRLVHISRMEVGAICAAANLGLVFGDCYYHVLASYIDNELSYYGPGGLHLRELMAFAISAGLKRFDFTVGDEPYKLEWSDCDLQLYDYTATVTWRGLPPRWSSSAWRRVKRFIKQTPPLWRLALRARPAIGALFNPPPKQSAAAAVVSSGSKARPALACVMGDMDLVRPLTLAGIACAVVTRAGVPSLYSRSTQARLIWDDYSTNLESLVETLIGFGRQEPERPVLFYEEDGQVLLVSRFRERLAPAFRFVIADAPLIEDLLDKARFQALAERHGLPVPAGRRVDTGAREPADLDFPFPLVLKPLTRLERWNKIFGLRKALHVESAEALRRLWPQLRALGIDLLAQEFIAGAEACIESYHCYVDQRGSIAGEFTGRKIRTYPSSYGHTTALTITDADDVRRGGRAIVERLALTGVAKLDFKRDAQGALHLLEINPRFNLWHHAGARAGVNIPALVYADLVGLPRPPVQPAKAGVQWCRPWKDFPAARAGGVPLAAWALWTLRCQAKSSMAWDDPLPFVRSTLHHLPGRRRLGREPAGIWHKRHRT